MRVGLTVVAVMLAGAGFGAGPAIGAEAPAPTSANEASISSAKKELDALRASRGLPSESRGALPKLDLPGAPALSLGSDTPPPSISPKDGKQAAKRSDNWLVDAMQKNADATVKGKGRQTGRESDRDLSDRLGGLPGRVAADAASKDANGEVEEPSSGDLVQMQLELERRQTQREAAAETARKTDLPVVNPLNSYMADWMSARDYALLKPAAGADAGGITGVGGAISAVSGASESAGSPAGMASSRGDSISAAFGGVDRGFLAAPSGAAANPYLQPVETPAPPSTASLPVVSAPSTFPLLSELPSASATGAARSPGFGPAPQPAATPKVPDFVRPQNDEKFFKQLKRF